MGTAVRVLVGAFVGAVVLSGCFRVESSFDIKDDGTADVAFEFAFDLEVLEEFGAMFGQDLEGMEGMSVEELFSELGEPTDPCADFTDGLEDYGVTEEDLSSDGEVAVRCTVTGVPIVELTDVGSDSNMSVTQEDEVTTFDLTLDGVTEMFGGGEELAVPGFDVDELLQFTIRATAPGALTEHNAPSTDGSTAIWSITPDAGFISGDTATMSARWEPGSDSSSTWVIALVILVVAGVVVAGIVFAVRRSKGSDSGGSDVPLAPPPTAPGAAGPPTAPPASPPPPPPASGSPGGDLPPPPAT